MFGSLHLYSFTGMSRVLWIAGIVVTLLTAWPALAESSFLDPLDVPALMRSSVGKRPLLAVARAGDQLVAVGSRGMIVRSEDQGKTWIQSSVPVQSDLLAVNFPDSLNGWAVGHDGVILHTNDGGKTWAKQLDGRAASSKFKSFYVENAADPAASLAASQIEQNFKAGPSLPYLDVWFEDSYKGYVVGSFGMAAATIDGGKTWEPWLHRIDNDQLLNLNSVRGIGGNVYIAGEKGMVYRLDRAKRRFVKIPTGYAGSFFGLIGNADTILAFGLRGVVYRSSDEGKRWEPLKMPVEATISGATEQSGSGGFVLVNNAGQLLVSDAHANQFQVVQGRNSSHYTGVAIAKDGSLVVSGLGGVHTETLH
jgi:photosystem II stability/assembly factor-like uncharacterized protein